MKLKGIDCTNSYTDKTVNLLIKFDESDCKELYGLVDDWISKIGKNIFITIKEIRKKRSLNANAYFWTLLNQLAVKMNTTSDDLYKHYVRDYGVFQMILVAGADKEEAKKAFIDRWAKGHDSSGWFAEDFGNCIKVYFGTSTYDSKEMSRIINAVVEDCKSAGINTLTPDEIAHMVAVLG